MKRFLFLVTFACVAMFAACEYDDSALWGEIDGVKQELADHERRIAALEELCKQMNTNISALQTAVTALQNNDFVTNVAPITKDGETIGYTVTFSKSGSITIYNGEDGEDGEDGANGEDAVAPVIGVKQDSDGVYYWTLDGEWLTDDAGNKIKAEGKDGKDGEDATDGEDGVTPQLKIENEYWYVSYDNGATWKRLGKATGNSSTNVTDCNCIIKDVRQDNNNVYLELTDGTIITIPKSNGENNSGDNGDDGDTSATLPPSNEIWYTSTDGKIVEPKTPSAFGAAIVSNTYANGVGVIVFDREITEIGYEAFRDCSSLTSIIIPDSVTSIGKNAFQYCSSLTSVTIPDGVTEIGYDAFHSCSSLTSVTIPDSVTEIGICAFCDCSSLKAFYGKFASADNRYLIIDGVLNSFAPYGLTSYTIPDSVTEIGYAAFYCCSSLTSITIPDSVKTIGDYAFNICSSLKEFKGKFAADGGRCLIKDNTIIAYAEASGTIYTIPDSVTAIGDHAFFCCSSLTTITIPDSVMTIGESAFGDCSSLTSITIPDSVTKIGVYAFQFSSSLTSVNIGDSVMTIGDCAFKDCSSLTSVNIPDSVTTIGEWAFEDCSSLTNVTIPDSVTTIGEWAFSSCHSLTSVTIPDSVTTIGDYAFIYCRSLTSVYCKPTTPPSGGFSMFDSNASGRKIYVPVGSSAAYKAADGWIEYADAIEEKAM